ncbi:hypothetical protein [Fretibacterium fastidiosum]
MNDVDGRWTKNAVCGEVLSGTSRRGAIRPFVAGGSRERAVGSLWE